MNALGGRLVHVYVPVPSRGCPSRFELVAGQATGVAGLLVVPELAADGAGFTGGWLVAHAGSGRPVSPAYATVGEALAAATRLGAVPVACWDRASFAPPGREGAVAREAARVLGVPST